MKQNYHWCFLDPNDMDYHPLSPEKIPLGGSQSALAYLSRELVQQNHQATLLNKNSQPGLYAGVNAQKTIPYTHLASAYPADIYIALNDFKALAQIPAASHKKPYFKLFWNQHNFLVPGMKQLKSTLDEKKIDGIIFVSEWQRQSFIKHFNLPAERCFLQQNAMSPLFFERYQDLDFKLVKNRPLTLSYTSNPGRGLGVLLAVFPALKHQFPDLKLNVYSSLAGYQASKDQETPFQYLYQECKTLKDVTYCGGVSQAQLKEQMLGSHFLAYPNRYMETSCISAIEALASGNKIISSHLGALPETCSEYGKLIAYESDHRPFTFAYYQALAEELVLFQEQPHRYYKQIDLARNWAMKQYNWPDRAKAWHLMADQLFSGSHRLMSG